MPGKTISSKSRSTKAVYLLVSCICFFVAGALVLLIGALSHANPQVGNFAGLFRWEPLMNLVASITMPFTP
ncbi:hypothetical protein [Taibaiella chishuiensis]|uniref:Uncharacterized protein n=1 Tax=Taibaiella chishuiensis TaxID=1434707 RepID=A0A2P8DAN5_9BACT|nr:hypothetical protein [Taibaiella chishuiensis]PSK94272.1 hypothetical protein B0I18_101427 [Taibaiella chishuiensis]